MIDGRRSRDYSSIKILRVGLLVYMIFAWGLIAYLVYDYILGELGIEKNPAQAGVESSAYMVRRLSNQGWHVKLTWRLYSEESY